MTGAVVLALLEYRPQVAELLGDRVYSESADQAADYPYAVFAIPETTPVSHMGGQAGFAFTKVVIQVTDTDEVRADQANRALRLALAPRQGTFAGVEVRGTFLSKTTRDTSEIGDGGDTVLYHRSFELRIAHREEVLNLQRG